MKNFSYLVFLTVFVPASVTPGKALAFEHQLPTSEAQELIAKVYLKDRNSDLLITNDELPTDSYLTASVVVAAYPSTKTEIGSWPTPATRISRFAFAPLDVPLKLVGAASFYSRAGCLGCDPNVIMANGQPLDDNALTLAIPAHLVKYVGRPVRVTNPVTGQSVMALATDTGGFHNPKYDTKWGSRVADLTIATKNAIGMKGGLGPVEIEVY